MRMSPQDALLTPRGGGGNGSQLLVESTTGSQLLQQQQQKQLPPPPPEPSWMQSRGQFANVMGGTLDRHAAPHGGHHGPPSVPNVQQQQYPSTFRGGSSYPMYHTCERPLHPATSKKRVTIVEDNNTESSV